MSPGFGDHETVGVVNAIRSAADPDRCSNPRGCPLASGFGSTGLGLSWVADSLGSLLGLAACFVAVCGLIWVLMSGSFRSKPKPFDSTIWKDEKSKRNGDRYRMVDDLARKIRGMSREEVIALLGEPDRPCPRHYSDAPDRSCDLAYYLCPSRPIGRYELLICLDEQARVTAAHAEYLD
jgi:hypothetical protein